VGRGASAQQVAAAILDAALTQARGNARGALESADPEYLHQLRVGLRRYRAALRVFRAVLRRKQRKLLARRARAAMQPLGEVRDWDVFVDRLLASKAPEALVQQARRRRDAAHATLEALDLCALEPPPGAWKARARSSDELRSKVLPKLRRKALRRASTMDWRDPAERHRLRIDIKRLRYATDFLGGETQALETLQGSLGQLNDLAVARRLLAGLDPPAAILRKMDADKPRLLAAARRQAASLQPED
jgi:CHAD domain-containing protein